MDLLNILVIVFILSITFYLTFLLIGVGGISKNREAQGFAHKSNK